MLTFTAKRKWQKKKEVTQDVHVLIARIFFASAGLWKTQLAKYSPYYLLNHHMRYIHRKSVYWKKNYTTSKSHITTIHASQESSQMRWKEQNKYFAFSWHEYFQLLHIFILLINHFSKTNETKRIFLKSVRERFLTDTLIQRHLCEHFIGQHL